ncbi:SDR family oxidoreductase [Larkinella soli]|uniref:SDR family oxidoreductase n=1 Tax=Larkinella soli TaxID=1770527 RepID=UPI000FFB6B25|nr:SDR family oxidoreductase [Larkinella soli]
MFSTISILGCGWLGLPLAERLVQAGFQVKGSTTSAEKLALLEQKGIRPFLLRLNPQPEGEHLRDFLTADALIINIPPKAGQMGDGFHPEQIRNLVRLFRETDTLPPYLMYISSTSVYPDLNREMTESDVVVPGQSAAPAYVEAELELLALGHTTVLRFGGLLGYDRIPGRYVAGKKGLTTGAVPVNYIHRDDGVAVLEALLRQPQPGRTFNVVAPRHPTREAVYRKNSEDFGYELPTFTEPETPAPFKIISSRELQQTVGYAFRYDDPLKFFYRPR